MIPYNASQTTVFLLTILQAIINEQIKAKQLKKNVGTYIYSAVKDQAQKMKWI